MNQPIQTLLQNVPVSIPLRFRQRFETRLNKLQLKHGPNGRFTGFTSGEWQAVYDSMTTITNSHGRDARISPASRRRYRSYFNRISQAWQTAGLVEQPLLIKDSPQHRRRLVLQIESLGDCRHSTYQFLIGHLSTIITGNHSLPSLNQPFSSKYLPEICLLMLVASGACFHGSIRRLLALKIKDIPTLYQRPLTILKSNGWVRISLSPMIHLLLLALASRQSCPNAFLFPWSNIQDAYKALTRFLKEAVPCSGPPMTLSDFIHHTRFELRTILTNTELAALLGQTRFNPTPEDQLLQLLSEADLGISGEQSPDVRATITNMPDIGIANETDEAITDEQDLTDLAIEYQNTINHIEDDLKEILEHQRVKTSLKAWLDKPHDPDHIVDSNIRLLVSWLVNLTPKVKSAKTLNAYWSSVWNGLLDTWPDLYVWKIDQEEMEEYLNAGWAYGTAGKHRAAWKSLYQYLVARNVPDVAIIEWEKIKIHWNPQQVRAVMPSCKVPLMQNLAHHSQRLAWLIVFAGDCGMRVSEIAALRVRDIIPGTDPYIIVRRSKRGKSRRVSLRYIPSEIQTRLFHLCQKMTEKGENRNPFFFHKPDGQPFTASQIANIIARAMEEIDVRDGSQPGRQPSAHRLRALAAEQAYESNGDIRAATLQLGHSMPATTNASYMHLWEYQIIQKLHHRRWAFQRGNDHLPLVVLASLLKMSDRGLVEAINTYTRQHPDDPIALKPAKDLPDGPRHPRRGRQALYVSAEDMVRFLSRRLYASTMATE